MLPLDLRIAPPRSPWIKLDGLLLMPSSIDKLRSKLPGGRPGSYLTHVGVTQLLFKIIRIEETALSCVVAEAQTEDDVAAWLRANADASRYEKANGVLANLTVDQVSADLRQTFEQFYTGRDPAMRRVLDVLDWDDRRMFGIPTADRV
ncbi:MAG: DUF5069 domain-containing protein [Candidatus Eremiobacteraeota bacterium]|nr:DUF5069 domain-containing protein [Candidatus Eremiobacteraeota bacterium]